MNRRWIVVFILFSMLMIPASSSMETDMSAYTFEEGCSCHAQFPTSENISISIEFGEGLENGFIPGEVYVGSIKILDNPSNTGEDNSNNTVFHLVATEGELNFSGESLHWSNTVIHNETWLSTHHSSMVNEWNITWTAPINVTDYRPVNLTAYGMMANGDGDLGGDLWGIEQETIWTNALWVYDYQQNETNPSNGPGVNGISSQTQDELKQYFLGDIWGSEDTNHPGWACYEWGYWNYQEIDKSIESWGCPHYEGMGEVVGDDKNEPFSETELGEFLGLSLEIFLDEGFWAILLIGLLGCSAWYLSNKRLERFLEEDETILAARNSVYESMALLLFYGNALYAAITFFILILLVFPILLGDEFYAHVWVIISLVEISNGYDLILCLGSLLLFSFGFAKAGQNQQKISQLHFDARIKLIGGGSPSHIEQNESREEEDEGTDEERTEPVTFSEILEALDTQLKEAIEEAHDLREELEETKSKVITLEEEVQEKDMLIGEIEASKSTLNEQIDLQDQEKKEGKKLSLTDSVMVGDSIMGGMKIDKQINNDPDAIARAVIAAYRAGREDNE